MPDNYNIRWSLCITANFDNSVCVRKETNCSCMWFVFSNKILTFETYVKAFFLLFMPSAGRVIRGFLFYVCLSVCKLLTLSVILYLYKVPYTCLYFICIFFATNDIMINPPCALYFDPVMLNWCQIWAHDILPTHCAEY